MNKCKKNSVEDKDLSDFLHGLEKIDKQAEEQASKFSYLEYLNRSEVSAEDARCFLKESSSPNKNDKIQAPKTRSNKVKNKPKIVSHQTPLHTIVRDAKSAKEVQEVLEKEGHLNSFNDELKTPLMIAARYNTHVSVIKYLIKAGALLDIVDRYKKTALQQALENNPSKEVVLTLLNATPKKIIKSLKPGLLMLAAQLNPSVSVIKALLDYGEDINARDSNGMTPLLYAAASNPNPRVILTLLQNGADINVTVKNGLNALHIACGAKSMVRDSLDKEKDYIVANPKAVKALISVKVDVNARDALGRTPLMQALVYKPWNFRYCGYTKKIDFSESKQVVQLLLKNGADVNITDTDGMTAFMHCVYCTPDVSVARLLLKAGTDVNIKNKKGKTALYYTSNDIHPAYRWDFGDSRWNWREYKKVAKLIKKYQK